jgi:hypothetical protein
MDFFKGIDGKAWPWAISFHGFDFEFFISRNRKLKHLFALIKA